MLTYAFHAHRTTIRTSTNATLCSLVYGMEAVMPLEIDIPSLWILKDAALDESGWARLRFEQLNLIDEKRLAIICHHQLYQSRMTKANNKKPRPRAFKEEDLTNIRKRSEKVGVKLWGTIYGEKGFFRRSLNCDKNRCRRSTLMRTSLSRGHVTHNQNWDLIPESRNRFERSMPRWKPAPRHQHFWNEVEWCHKTS
jgi:hypothetical protein